MNKDDQDWLDALAGRPDPAADPATNRRAAALREAMLAIRREELAAESPDEGLDRLLFRLRREGLLETRKKPWLLQFPAMFAIAATVLISAGFAVIYLADKKDSAPEVLQSSAPGDAFSTRAAAQLLFAAAPEDFAAGMQQKFSDAGIPLKQTPSAQGVRLEGDLPGNLPPDALRILDEYRLSIPDDRKLVIEIRQQATQ